jgi:hypothetical protein
MNDRRMYTVLEVSGLMGFSRATITRLFKREPGVLVLRRPEQMHKRGYSSMRIPHAVYLRVVERLSI